MIDVEAAADRFHDDVLIPTGRPRLLRTPVDLHVHSRVSDGDLADAELVLAAARRGVRVLARVDHDTLAGAEDFAATARAHGIECIHGCEISVWWRAAEWHLLAYHVDPADRLLAARLASPGVTTMADALAWVDAAGGVPVLAHPGRSIRPDLAVEELRPLVDGGLAGIEVWTTWHDVETSVAYADVARRLGLLATQGSDFHGPSRPWAPAPGMLPAASAWPGAIIDGLALLAEVRP